jgi:hypothetical protein
VKKGAFIKGLLKTNIEKKDNVQASKKLLEF